MSYSAENKSLLNRIIEKKEWLSLASLLGVLLLN